MKMLDAKGGEFIRDPGDDSVECQRPIGIQPKEGA
jgi:hypothetical protein